MATDPRNDMYYQRADGTTVPVRRPEAPEDAGPYQPTGGYYQPEYRPQYSTYQQPPVMSQPPLGQPPPPPSASPIDKNGPFASKEEKKQHMIVRILRVLFIVFQSVALLAGIALVIAGSLWYRAVRKHKLHNTFIGTLPMLAIGAGVALALLSCIGLVSAITRGRSGAVVYSLLVGCLIGSQAYMLYKTEKVDKQVMGYLSTQWEEMGSKQRRIFQEWRKCCGFGAPDDRAAKPCPGGASVGCALPIHATIKKWAGSIIKTLAIAIGVEIVLVVLALVISFAKFRY